MTDIKDEVKATEVSATGWVKTHIAWIIGAVCFLVGFILGHIKL
jgi:4-hydroxybenzoate polyprenyltransferase